MIDLNENITTQGTVASPMLPGEPEEIFEGPEQGAALDLVVNAGMLSEQAEEVALALPVGEPVFYFDGEFRTFAEVQRRAALNQAITVALAQRRLPRAA
ncbi:MAG: hypothetical protein FJ317_00085 [SAR202 cluster bacterium]|nr:hypothetical protein [SAR202 cluster bacterium]